MLKVANDAVARLLEHHDQHGDEDEVELFLRDRVRQTDGGVGGLTLQRGQATVGAQLRFDEREGQDGVDAEEQEREPDFTMDGQEGPNAVSP